MRLSLIIPVYNVEKYLGDCLTTAFSQQLSDYEVICVNDGSQDKSLEILEKYANNYPNITIISQSNKGLSGARNTGLYAAKGDYVFFLDSDDYFIDTTTLYEILKFSESNNLDICVFNALVNGQLYYSDSLGKFDDTVITGKEYFVKSFAYARDIVTPIWMHMYKRDFLLTNGFVFKEGLLHEDELFTPWTVYEAQRLACIDKPIVHYRYNRKESITSNITQKNYEHRLDTARGLFYHFVDVQAIDEAYRLVFTMYMNLSVEMGSNMREQLFNSDDSIIMKSCAKTPYEKKCYKLFKLSPEIMARYRKNAINPLARKIINRFL